MKPNLKEESRRVGDTPARELYEAIQGVAGRDPNAVAVKQAKQSEEVTYAELVEEAAELAKSIPFEEHPIVIDMEPGIAPVVAVVAALQRGCRPVSNDRTSKIKLIVNDEIVRVWGKTPRHRMLHAMMKGMANAISMRPDIEFEHRRQLRHQDFIDTVIAVLTRGGQVIVRNKDKKVES